MNDEVERAQKVNACGPCICTKSPAANDAGDFCQIAEHQSDKQYQNATSKTEINVKRL